MTKNKSIDIDITAIILARMGSTRLPEKVISPLSGEPLLARIVERIRPAKNIGKIVLATTDRKSDDRLVILADSLGIECFRGSELDVMGRFSDAVREYESEAVVCFTGDNPLIDTLLIDDVIDFFLKEDCDYVGTTTMQHSDFWKAERTFPTGVSVQVLRADVLLAVDDEITDPAIREHATFGIYHRGDNRYKICAFQAEGAYLEWRHPELRLTVDTQKDYDLMKLIYDKLYTKNPNFSTLEAIKLVAGNSQFRSINSNVKQKRVY